MPDALPQLADLSFHSSQGHQRPGPGMLVIRTSDGEIRWMDVSAYLKGESAGGKAVRQMVFAGERFDAMSVQNWRKKLLG